MSKSEHDSIHRAAHAETHSGPPHSAGATATSPAITIGAAPVVTGFSPASGNPGTIVTISGKNFVNVQAVLFNAANALFTVVSSTQIRATVPGNATTGPISVKTSAGVGRSSTIFIVKTATTGGLITELLPNSATRGTTIAIIGQNFTNVQSVSYAGVNSTRVEDPDFMVASVTRINSTVPDNAVSGPLTVVTAQAKGSAQFTVLPAQPEIDSFSPGSGPVGTQVTITGKNFDIGSIINVFFNGAVAVFQIISPTELITTVPPGATTGYITFRTGIFPDPTSLTEFVVT
jgi:IPT/TIG domain